ncbi:DUF6507 family protein [Kribbella sp. NPDC050820]|uniref:DUF6507 family protein n=1 Tax=Kribbella sp. NPDC050820 TaxID=3155408 RepID=UPI0033E1E279
MGWDIDVEGTGQVLIDTATAAEPFNELLTTYGEALEALMLGTTYLVVDSGARRAGARGGQGVLAGDTAALGCLNVVSAAIGEYSAHWAPTLEDAATQVTASLTGLQNALEAYLNGQEEMVMNAQRNAANGYIPDPTAEMPTTHGGDVAV